MPGDGLVKFPVKLRKIPCSEGISPLRREAGARTRPETTCYRAVPGVALMENQWLGPDLFSPGEPARARERAAAERSVAIGRFANIGRVSLQSHLRGHRCS